MDEAPNDIRSIVQAVIQEFVKSEQTRAEPAYKTELVEERKRRENLEQKFKTWLDQEAARAVPWTILRPREAKGNVPHLSILDDRSVLAGGDQTKRDAAPNCSVLPKEASIARLFSRG